MRFPPILFLVCAAIICSFAVPQRVSAQAARSCVAVVRGESDDRLPSDANVRLRAEVHSAGFEVVEVDLPPGDARAQVENAANRSGCFATVALHGASFGALADAWISDHLTGKTVVRRIEVSRASNASTVLAIRSLELLRASLLEIAEPLGNTAPERAAPPDVLQWVEPTLSQHPPSSAVSPGQFALGVSVLGIYGTKGLRLAGGPSLRLEYGFTRYWFGRLSLTGPLFGPEPARDQGRAAVRQEFASVDVGMATDARPFGAFGWVGVGAFHLHVIGSASAPYRAKSDNVWSLLTNAGLGAIARLGPRAALTIELAAHWLIPRPVVVIADRDVGVAGAPSLSLAAGALVAF
jgi:hypothetical protein